MKKNTNPLNWKTALGLSVAISLFISVLNLLISIFFEHYLEEQLMKSGKMFVISTAMLFVLYLFAFKIIQLPLKYCNKALIVIFGSFLLTFGLGTVVFFIIKTIEVRSILVMFNVINHLIFAFIIWLTVSRLYLKYIQQQTLIENERLIAENIRNRYETLKNQIDPHFLFNSLNTLNGLIGFDDERAREYVEKLSSVFRYTIQNKEITTLHLQEELDFTNSYTYLMKIRYGENLTIESDISEKYLSYSIMPISIQLLVENAIKHNVISNKYPLIVRICTTKTDKLIVENNVRTKEFSVSNSGIGLANLCERYKLLFQKEVVISNTNNIFRVEIPLIKV